MRILIALSILILTGCDAAKKVLKNQMQFEQVGRAWALKNPCTNDSAIIFLPGRIDSIPYVIAVDTALLNAKADSVTKALAKKYNYDVAECNRQVSEAFNTGFDEAVFEISKQKMPVKLPDTIRISVTDKRSLKACQDSYEEMQKQFTDELQAGGKIRSQRNVGYIISGILAAALVLITIILFKKK